MPGREKTDYFRHLATAMNSEILVSKPMAAARWSDIPLKQADGSLERIGQSLLSTYSMSFELISVVLLVAMVGALVLAREGRDRQ